MDDGRQPVTHCTSDAARGGASGTRPTSTELFAAAAELVAGGSGSFKSTARRYSICTADADDAYQRGLEILMTKAPTASRDELRPWLHTVIKHEALAIRGQRERLLAGGSEAGPDSPIAGAAPGPDEGAGERERARRTAEALGGLKPGEIQCLLLKALGYSYDEISARTGFSWTKVNRCLTEGRRSFFAGFGQIESGERCRRYAPLLSAASDGEATPEDERVLRAHLRGCHSCRAALRAYKDAPSRLAQLLPPAMLLPALQRGNWWSRLAEHFAGGSGDRAGALGYKLQQAGELLGAQKAAAVVASTAALAGGAAVHRQVDEPRRADRDTSRLEAKRPQLRPPPSPVPAPQPDAGTQAPADRTAAGRSQTAEKADAGASGDSAGEFGFEAAAASATSDEPAGAESATSENQRPSAAGTSEFAPMGGGSGKSGAASVGEFGP